MCHIPRLRWYYETVVFLILLWMDVNDLGQLLLWPKLRVLIKGSARGQCTVHSAQGNGGAVAKFLKNQQQFSSFFPADLPVIWCFLLRWHSGLVRDGWGTGGGSRGYVEIVTVVICWGGKFVCAANAVHWFSDLQIFIDLLVGMPWSWFISIILSQQNIVILHMWYW